MCACVRACVRVRERAWCRVFTVAGIVATMLSKTADLVSKKGSLGKLG